MAPLAVQNRMTIPSEVRTSGRIWMREGTSSTDAMKSFYVSPDEERNDTISSPDLMRYGSVSPENILRRHGRKVQNGVGGGDDGCSGCIKIDRLWNGYCLGEVVVM